MKPSASRFIDYTQYLSLVSTRIWTFSETNLLKISIFSPPTCLLLYTHITMILIELCDKQQMLFPSKVDI